MKPPMIPTWRNRVTLYRAGERSPIVDALARAAKAGKDVTAFVELKARFDEERNVTWAKHLEAAGVHVVHGVQGVKNHAKVAMVVRREDGIPRRYVHVGTGNYNAETARAYTDFGLLTARETLCADVNDLFNALTGSSALAAHPYRDCLVAPAGLLPGLIERIEREADHARSGRGGQIRMKLNGLSDADVVRALYRAARAGVEIELIVRGICTLSPGAPAQPTGSASSACSGAFSSTRASWSSPTVATRSTSSDRPICVRGICAGASRSWRRSTSRACVHGSTGSSIASSPTPPRGCSRRTGPTHSRPSRLT